MQVAANFRWFQVAVALVAVTWTGCATINGITPFNLASHRGESSSNVATPSQLATPRTDVPSPDGYQAQFVSTPTTRPQQRYSAPSCTSRFG